MVFRNEECLVNFFFYFGVKYVLESASVYAKERELVRQRRMTESEGTEGETEREKMSETSHRVAVREAG